MCLADPDSVHVGEALKSLLLRNEFNALNFEAPLRAECGQPISKSGPAIFQNDLTPAWTMANGWNVISLANNHAMDYGEESLRKTIEAFRGRTTAGAGNFSQAYSAKILDTGDGRKLGIIACTQHEFGVLEDWTSARSGCAWIGHPEIIRTILETRKQTDILVMFAHAGVEMTAHPLPEWRRLYKSFIDLGCDAVIASHPHVPQGKETYKGKPIVYSLGNLCFQRRDGKTPDLWNQGLICELKFDNDSNCSCSVVPVSFDSDRGVIELSDASSDIHGYLKCLDNCLGNPEEYISAVRADLRKLWPDYINLFASSGFISDPFSKMMLSTIKRRVLGRERDMTHLLNNLQKESHRWAIERLLRMNYGIDY